MDGIRFVKESIVVSGMCETNTNKHFVLSFRANWTLWRFRFFFHHALDIILLASFSFLLQNIPIFHIHFIDDYNCVKKIPLKKNVWTNLKSPCSWQHQRATSCSGLSKWKHTNIPKKRQTVSSNINIWMTTNQKKNQSRRVQNSSV